MTPLTDAVAKISAKTPIGSILRSREWSAVPLALRERAQFSAGVQSARVLQTIQDRLAAELQNIRETLADGKTATFDRSSFIDRIRSIARQEGLTPVDQAIRGGLQDITSIPRLGLIHDIQKSQAQEFARWKLDQEEGALDLYPAQQLTRIEPRLRERDWPRRWAEAGAAVGWEGALRSPMIARKNSPIWAKLSRFGTPWPPFDFGSGMGLEDIDRDRAIQLGLITEDTDLTPSAEPFNATLEASARGLSPRFQGALKKFFGDQISITGDRVRWKEVA